MVPDAECIKVADEVMRALDLGVYEIRLNHRVLLEGVFRLAGIADADFKTVSASVDKLDKAPWGNVRDELINEKKIDAAAVDRLRGYVMARGGRFSLVRARNRFHFQRTIRARQTPSCSNFSIRSRALM